jgi:hypothetical protein
VLKYLKASQAQEATFGYPRYDLMQDSKTCEGGSP